MNASPYRVLAALLLLASCQSPQPSESETRPPGENVLTPAQLAATRSGPVDFTTHVRPILQAKCVMCHNHDALPGKVNLTSRDAARRTGALGVWIVPGKPDQSHFVTKVCDAPGALQAMPPVGQQITTDELAVLRKWIAEGASWPAGPSGWVTELK